jgi:hypothetical protein
MPFVIFALPRSRTAWLSRFLSYGEWSCGHEEIRHARTMEDVKSWFAQPCTGTAETAGAPWWRLVQRISPDAKIVVVRRRISDVVTSLMNLGLPFNEISLIREMTRLDHKLDQIERRMSNVLSVQFDDLATEATCAQVFEHCLPYKHDPAWWAAAAAVNVQINMTHLLRYFSAHQPQLTKLAKMAKQQTIAGMARKSVEPDGVTIQQESFETFYRDGTALFAEHLVQVGESPDAFMCKNIELMRVLDQLGAMQITTARSNGRMFGYLMAIINPSLESEEITSAVHTTFFASADFRGLGIKLQRASIEALRARGVDELIMRAGPRGSGPRMGALYRRLGAEDDGQMFKLNLVEAA